MYMFRLGAIFEIKNINVCETRICDSAYIIEDHPIENNRISITFESRACKLDYLNVTHIFRLYIINVVSLCSELSARNAHSRSIFLQ